jgi:cytochrome c peroxidase
MATTSAEDSALRRAKPRRRFWKFLLAAIIVIPFGALLLLGLWPVRADFAGSEGLTGVDPNGAGLRRPFPSMIVATDNPVPVNPSADQRVALGKLLFFDPIVSGDNTVSCATCHHPDLGFSDGRSLSSGKGGKGIGPDRAGGAVVKRGAPSIWNAAYNHLQFWDGRAATLEEQATKPITSDVEMDQRPDELVRELKAIPEYVAKFDGAFKAQSGEGITFENVVKAIASFERTLTANDSPFDRYVKGDLHALTAAQRRGFNLFRSGKTRCFECHGLPTFANRDFKVIGVPGLPGQEPDYGRFDVTKGEGNKGAFKVPTLRNVVLNAPYMHNGRFSTLEEVIDFYASGGGPGVSVPTPNLDDKIRPYSITPEERSDLIAFLYSLTDESKVPEFPEKVPSGFPVVGHLENRARPLVSKHNTGAAATERVERAPMRITVRVGESIQAALDRARPGDTIEVAPGIYSEELIVDLDNITLIGMTSKSPFETAKADPELLKKDNPSPAWPVLDGRKKLSDGVIATGSGFRIQGFEVRNYVANGVVVQHANNPVFHDLLVSHTGLYGTYPVSCTGVKISKVIATGIADAAIYVGQSRDIEVVDSIAYGNVTGIEIENSINAVVERNYVYDNAGGILVFLLPNNVSKVGRDTRVAHNRVVENNHVNFGNPHSTVGQVPPGGGILVMAADNTVVTANEIIGNDSYGIAVSSLETNFPKGTRFDVGTTPENNWIHDNTFERNGGKPAPAITKLGLKGADLLWDLSGSSNRWDEKDATKSTPVLDASWPELARRAYWRVLQLAVKYL